MDATTIAWIGFVATIMSGGLSGYLSRTDAFDKLLSRNRASTLAGTIWESQWNETDSDGRSVTRSETFRFEKQLKNRVLGTIEMPQYPTRKWVIDGDYNDRFLRLFWTPSKDSPDRFFLDYGVYFFERHGDGIFGGYAVGFDAEENKVVVVQHSLTLTRVR